MTIRDCDLWVAPNNGNWLPRSGRNQITKPHILAAYPNCSLFKENPAFQPFSWKCRVEESNQISKAVNSLASKIQIVYNLTDFSLWPTLEILQNALLKLSSGSLICIPCIWLKYLWNSDLRLFFNHANDCRCYPYSTTLAQDLTGLIQGGPSGSNVVYKKNILSHNACAMPTAHGKSLQAS